MGASKLTAAQLELCERFARAKPKASLCYVGPDFANAVPRYFPVLVGRGVRNLDDPPGGYISPVDARAAAARFRERCRVYLAGRSALAAEGE
jgi:hypothetical protein